MIVAIVAVRVVRPHYLAAVDDPLPSIPLEPRFDRAL